MNTPLARGDWLSDPQGISWELLSVNRRKVTMRRREGERHGALVLLAAAALKGWRKHTMPEKLRKGMRLVVFGEPVTVRRAGRNTVTLAHRMMAGTDYHAEKPNDPAALLALGYREPFEGEKINTV